MKLSGDVELRTTELSDALQFVVIRDSSLYEEVLAPVIILVALWYFWKIAFGLYRLILIFVAISGVTGYVANKLHGRETRILIREDGIIAKGNLGRIFSTHFQVMASDISRIRFGTIGEDGPSGLCVWQGGTMTCVLPGINEEQADSIVEQISQRFPLLPTEHSSSLSWRGEPLIDLKLSKLNRQDSDKRS
jgi:hypothetical protein